MPVGLQIYNASGQLVVDHTDRVGRLIGIQRITGVGSITHAQFSTGDIFYVYVPDNSVGVPPQFVISGTTLSWNNRGGTSAIAGYLYYGVS